MNVIKALKDNLVLCCCFVVHFSVFVLIVIITCTHCACFFSFGFIRASLYIRFMYGVFAEHVFFMK